MNAPRTTPRPNRERGSISVEFALMLTFFFMPLLLGIIDFGQILHAQSVVARAAREGAVAAARSQDVNAAVDNYIRNAGYDLNLTHISAAGSQVSGDPVTVTVRYDTSAMVIIPWQGISPNMTQVVATATAQQF